MRVLWSIFFVLVMALPISAQDQTGDCAGLVPAPLTVGEQGQVSPGQSNNVRDVPSLDGARVGQLPGGAQFGVLDGPACSDGLVWWQVESEGLVGWTVDGMDGEQWLFPVTGEATESASPPVLSTTVIVPENVAQLQSNRNLSCDNGPSHSSLIALGTRYLALNCGFYNMNASNASLSEQLLQDRLGIIDLETGEQVMTLSGDGSDAYPIAFLPDNRLLWFSNESRNEPVILHLSDITTGEEIEVIEIEDQTGTGLFIHPVFYANGTRFALFYEDDGDYVLHRWDATTLTLLEEQVFDKPEALIDGNDLSFAISPNGERFALIYEADTTSELAIYASGNQRPEAVIATPFAVFNLSAKLTFSPSGNFIIGAGCRLQQIACGDPTILWWAASDGTQVAEWDIPVDYIGSLRFSPDGNLMAMGASGGALLYAVDTGEVVHVLQGPATQAIFSADGTFILTHGDPTTTIWTVGE